MEFLENVLIYCNKPAHLEVTTIAIAIKTRDNGHEVVEVEELHGTAVIVSRLMGYTVFYCLLGWDFLLPLLCLPHHKKIIVFL